MRKVRHRRGSLSGGRGGRQSPNTDLPVMVTNFAARSRIAAAALKSGSLSKASLAAASLNQVTTI